MPRPSVASHLDTFKCRSLWTFEGTTYQLISLPDAERNGAGELSALPFCLRVIAECLLRNEDASASQELIRAFVDSSLGTGIGVVDVPFKPRRILMQDYAGLPALLDFAALRSHRAAVDATGRPIEPACPVDLVIDHSLIVHHTRTQDAAAKNLELEFELNRERFAFLKWAQGAFHRLRVIPPGNGIVHQINLESLAEVVSVCDGSPPWLVPDSVLGTDSHTTMINGLGVLGWGIGGIEAEAIMLGQAVPLPSPRVVRVTLQGRPPPGATAADIALTLAEYFRKDADIVGSFVEFDGAGLDALTVPDRATVANMSPEFGCTCAYFPCDSSTLQYLAQTGRSPYQVRLTQAYLKRNGLYRTHFGAQLKGLINEKSFDLSKVERCIAGPSRPDQRVVLSQVPRSFSENAHHAVIGPSTPETLQDGDIVLAAITSCTNTSHPRAMATAGLLAKRAHELGLQVPRYVKTSLTPGSLAVTEFLRRADLLVHLQALGFAVAGYGCGTCVGNSGDLDPAIDRKLRSSPTNAVAVLSGNRNFPGRIHPLIKSSYLMSPPLVIAFALAGTIRRDLDHDALATSPRGEVFLADLWPTEEEIDRALALSSPALFVRPTSAETSESPHWRQLLTHASLHPDIDSGSTFIKLPDLRKFANAAAASSRAVMPESRALLILGDNVTTDHISPVGRIAADSAAGNWLRSQGVSVDRLSTYGARRGNHEVMTRGTFANPRLQNEIVPNREGPWTRVWNTESVVDIFNAAEAYQAMRQPTIIVAGKQYGMGSARDWAAKGVRLLGVTAVLAESFERIHRTNLALLGVLPLQFLEGDTRQSLNLGLDDRFEIKVTVDALRVGEPIALFITRSDNSVLEALVMPRLDTEFEQACFAEGGVLAPWLRDGP